MEIDVESKQIVDIKKEVEEEALKFRKTTTKEPCQKYFDPKEPADVNWNNKEVYIDALYQGYLDACRTIHWNSKANEDGKKLLKEKKNGTKKEIKKEVP